MAGGLYVFHYAKKHMLNGKLSERFKEAVLKTVGGAEPSVGSNPTLPAICAFSSVE